MMFQARNYRLLVFYEQIASCRERVQYVRGDGINSHFSMVQKSI
jgi:hypothetical protein